MSICSFIKTKVCYVVKGIKSIVNFVPDVFFGLSGIVFIFILTMTCVSGYLGLKISHAIEDRGTKIVIQEIFEGRFK